MSASRSFFSSVGLRAQATLISVGLIALTALLGVRAYSVGLAHLTESRELLEKDVPAQKLIFQIESARSALEQARKKLLITKDPAYSRLIWQARRALDSRRRKLVALRPELAFSSDLNALEQRIASEREQSVRHARDTARGLVRLIGIALGLSLLITAWLILLLYEGLVKPLRALGLATQRVRSGDLSTRIEERGVAELRELSRSFNSMASRLESLDRAKSEFLTMISHELRNPMAALKEGLALLSTEEKALSEESRKRCLSACVIASKRLEHMINNLLSLSHSNSIESGAPEAFRYELTQNNLHSAIQSSVAEVRPLAEKKGMQISVKCPQELCFGFNREALVQAFVNLLLNAVKYGADSSMIEIIAEEEPGATGRVRIAVSNAGKEIPSRELGRVFDAFYRGENSAKQQGMGIGLHVVKKVVAAHRGIVSALSEAGRTRMVITLPLSVWIGCLFLGMGTFGCSAPKPVPRVDIPLPMMNESASSLNMGWGHWTPNEQSNAFVSIQPVFRLSAIARKVERKLRHTRGEQILISRRLLERLLREHRTDLSTCNRVSGQLEALKKVDVDGPHPFDR